VSADFIAHATQPRWMVFAISMGKATKCVCCCCNTILSCVVSALLIVIVLAIALFFLFPTPPQVTISDLFIPSNSKAQINGIDLNAGIGLILLRNEPFNLTYPVAVNVTVASPSYINIGIKKVDALVEVLDKNQQKLKDFQGLGSVESLDFAPRSNTTFTFVRFIKRSPLLFSINLAGLQKLLAIQSLSYLGTSALHKTRIRKSMLKSS
jgi:hypothetical protein